MFSLTSTLISTLSILPTLLPAVLAHPQPLPLPITSSSPGCGKPHTLPGTTHYRLNLPSPAANNTTTRRSYSYHLPANYNPSTPYPVVLGFHGSSSTGVFFELDTKMSEARFSGDKIVVYPNGEGWSWAGASYHEGSSLEEDVGFVERAVRDLGERVCVDGGRVYAVGMSNGGGFVNALACSETGQNLFAAFAIGSGAFYPPTDTPCNPTRPIPMLEIHGGKDRTVKYGGGKGEGGELPSIEQWLNRWATRNNCNQEIVEDTSDGGNVHHLSWTCNDTSGYLQHYKIDDMGHCWADTELNLSQLSVPQLPGPIQASKVVMEFFAQFRKSD